MRKRWGPHRSSQLSRARLESAFKSDTGIRERGNLGASGKLRLTLFVTFLSMFFLAMAAQASALGTMTVAIEGQGEVSSTEGLFGTLKGIPPIECSTIPGEEKTVCENEMEFDGESFTGVALKAPQAAPGWDFDHWEVLEGVAHPATACTTATQCVAGRSGESTEDAEVKAVFVEEAAPPSVTALVPDEGPTAGGNPVTIEGTGLTTVEEVLFGANPATGIVEVSPTEIEVTAPAGAAGTVDVSVTTPGGTSANTAADDYTYVEAPAVTSCNPTEGPAAGGTTVTITGTDLANVEEVLFGANPATGIVEVSPTEIEVTSPPGAPAETVDVLVVTPGGQSAAPGGCQFTYEVEPPAVNALNPTSGPTAGGNSVVITGTAFTGATEVKFGANPATFAVDSSTQITATAPAGAAGAVDVSVTTPGGTSANTPADNYSYVDTPTVTVLNPTSGPTAGGNTVEITGTNLGGATKVKFGTTEVSPPFTENTATKIKVIAPAGAAGTVDVRVVTPGGESANTAADNYTYVEEHELDVAVTGDGDVDADSGAIVNCRESSGVCSDTYAPGTVVILTATADAGNQFAGWTGCEEEPSLNECKVTMDADKSVEAEFVAVHELFVEVIGNGEVDALEGAIFECDESGVSCADSFVEGTIVTLIAFPGGGSELVEWIGCDEVFGDECDVTMDGAKLVTAKFAPIPVTPEFDLDIDIVGPGAGTVKCDGGSCSSEYEKGAEVTLTAHPAPGSAFMGWAGGGCSGIGGCDVTLNSDVSVTAAFELIPPPPAPAPALPPQPAFIPGRVLVKGNAAFVPLVCRRGPCKGLLKLFAKLPAGSRKKATRSKRGKRRARFVLVGKRRFGLASGSSRVVRVPIRNRRAKRVLRQRGKLLAKVRGNGVKPRSVQLRKAGLGGKRGRSRG